VFTNMNKIRKKEKYVAVFLLISLCLFLLPAREVEAASIFLEVLAEATNGLMTGASKLLGWTGLLFDYSVEFSVMKNSQKFYKEGIVKTGWSLCRDLANLFFIFILIFIGIATILQLQSYGYKKLLLGVILAALLINFSGLITRVVIDASNVVATEFICKMGGKDCSLEYVSKAMMKGFKMQTILAKDPVTNEWTVLGSGGVKPAENSVLWKIIQITFFGTGLMLVMIFVLFMGALLFMTRTLVLMFLIIFAPLAFIGTAIGSSYATKWWRTLFNQSFVAPLYLFLIYIVVNHVTDQTWNTKSSFVALVTDNEPAIDILWQFIMMAGLLIGAYIIAKQLGGASAAGAIKMAKWGKGKATGYAGKIGKSGARLAGRQTVARIGEAITTDKTGRERQWLRTMKAGSPIFGGWAAEKVGRVAEVGGRKEVIEKMAKRGMTLPAEDRAKYISNLGRQEQNKMFRDMPARERAELLSKPSEKFKPTADRLMGILGIEEKEKTEKIIKETERTLARKEGLKQFRERGDTLNKDEARRIFTEMNMSMKDFRKITEEGGEATENLGKGLKALGDTAEDLAKEFEDMGNKSMAMAMTGPSGALLSGYDKKFGKETKETTKTPREQAEENWQEMKKKNK